MEVEQREGKRDVHHAKKQVQLNPPPPGGGGGASPPPSASSSPSHEFSFTISLHPPTAAAKLPDNKTKSPPPFAIDLSPADEIFFHGHLLPLHLLSHLPVSPRSSTNSMDSFTLPIKELLPPNDDNNNKASSIARTGDDDHDHDYDHNHGRGYQESSQILEEKSRGKSRSFSLFPKWRKERDDHQTTTDKKKPKFELLKRYMRFVKPFLSLRNKRENCDEYIRQQPYSYSSGNLRVRNKKEVRGRRGEFSAPASMITSPTNSGLLVSSGTATPNTSSDSTMEELQAAIQAAIAHCKNSIATEDKIKLP